MPGEGTPNLSNAGIALLIDRDNVSEWVMEGILGELVLKRHDERSTRPLRLKQPPTAKHEIQHQKDTVDTPSQIDAANPCRPLKCLNM